MCNVLAGACVYLAGPVDNDPECANWRDNLKNGILKDLSIFPYDPLEKRDWMSQQTKVHPSEYYKALNGELSSLSSDDTFNALDELRAVCLAAVTAADFIIVHMPRIFTFGTIVELHHASMNNKPVFFHSPDGIPSTWAISQFGDRINWKDSFFQNWEDLIYYIRMINNGRIQLDPIKWFRLAYGSETWPMVWRTKDNACNNV